MPGSINSCGSPNGRDTLTWRISISPSSFAEEDTTPLRLLEEAGAEVQPNPVRRRWTEDEAVEFLQGADGLIAGVEPLTARVLESAAGTLKAISRVGAGLDSVDLNAARRLGIIVANTPDAPADAVAEMTLTVLLAISRELEPMNRSLHERRWEKRIGRSLSELSVLVVGYGNIGSRVARLLSVLGARVSVFDPLMSERAAGDVARAGMLRHDTLQDALGHADVITLHASSVSTLMGDAELALCRPGLVLLNAARGQLVDEPALLRALDSGQVSRAWMDVFSKEPYSGPLCDHPAVLLTPHAATYTRACRLRMETEAVRNLLRDLGSRQP